MTLVRWYTGTFENEKLVIMITEINNQTKLSEHFTLRELTKTKTGISNVPNEEQVNNLKRLCGWLEKLRKRWNDLYGEGDDPIIINSGFRSPEVNKAVGGWAQSNHLTGCAVDIRCVGIEQAIRYATLLLDISDLNHEDFDELIIELVGELIIKGNVWLFSCLFFIHAFHAE